MSLSVRAHTPPSVYHLLGQRLPILLGWAAASLLAGVWWRRSRDARLHGAGDQFIAWGAVDGLIAAGGIAGARKNARRLEDGTINSQQHTLDARRFERIVWVNAALDIGYIAGGERLIQRSTGSPYRLGTGWGILIQGTFLLIWDIFLALIIRKYRRDRLSSP
jgi:hypothetical protein